MPIKIKFIGPIVCFSYPGEKMIQGELEHLARGVWCVWFWLSTSSSKPAPTKGIPLWYWLPILSGCIIKFNQSVVFSTHKASVSNVNLLYVLYNYWSNQTQGCWTWLISPLNILLTSHILWCLIQRNFFYPGIVASLLLLLQPLFKQPSSCKGPPPNTMLDKVILAIWNWSVQVAMNIDI